LKDYLELSGVIDRERIYYNEKFPSLKVEFSEIFLCKELHQKDFAKQGNKEE